MEYRVREGFEEKKGVISNTHGFLQTYLDGGFKEKWSGYWSPSHKYLDYFALKVNGVWLTGKTLEEASYGKEITYRHSTSSLEVKQRITCPDNLPGFKINLEIKNNSKDKTAVRTSLESGIDIRPKSKDFGDQSYSIESSKEEMEISKEDRRITISSKEFSFEENSYIKEHFPSHRQECLIPGKIFCNLEISSQEMKEMEIVFETDGDIGEAVKSSEATLRHPEIGRTFNYSLQSLKNLYYSKNGSGVIAGHPWFQNYWARDAFWTVLGMIDAGMFEEAEKILLNFAERDSFPSKIDTDGGTETDYPRCDSIPLFAIAVDKLDKYYELDYKLLDRAEELLRDERPRGRIVDNHKDGTWMDTLDRSKAVDIQSLWIEALDRFDRGTKRLQKGLKQFKKEKYMKDNLENDFESINPAIPLMFDQLGKEDAEEYLEKINGEFSSRYGARTRSVTDHGYDSSGYHTGSAWGLTTCWAAAANLQHGQKSHGINFLKKMAQFLDQNQLGAIPELVDAETGENLGCDEQAWSAGLFIHVIDSYLLGIELKDDKMVINPVEDISCKRLGKRVGSELVDIKVNNGQVEILNEPKLEIKKGR